MLGAAADGQVWVEIGDMRVDDSVLYSRVLLLDLPCDGVQPLELVGFNLRLLRLLTVCLRKWRSFDAVCAFADEALLEERGQVELLPRRRPP